jgi:hypothetical protein
MGFQSVKVSATNSTAIVVLLIDSEFTIQHSFDDKSKWEDLVKFGIETYKTHDQPVAPNLAKFMVALSRVWPYPKTDTLIVAAQKNLPEYKEYDDLVQSYLLLL